MIITCRWLAKMHCSTPCGAALLLDLLWSGIILGRVALIHTHLYCCRLAWATLGRDVEYALKIGDFLILSPPTTFALRISE